MESQSNTMPLWLSVLICLSILSIPTASSLAQDEFEVREYQIKASFIYRFIQFAQDPPGWDSVDAVTLCGVSSKRFSIIANALEGKLIGEKPLEIRHLNEKSSMVGCQVLFIDSTKNRIEQPDTLTSLSILTIGETDQFIRRGGLIRFFESRNKVRFEINVEAAKQAGITFSSKLLKLAKRV